MAIPELARHTIFETSLSLLCPKCNKPLIPTYHPEELRMISNLPDANVLVQCPSCDMLFAYFPSSHDFKEE